MTARELLNICNLPGIAPEVSGMRSHAPAPTVSTSGPQCSIGDVLLTHNGVFIAPVTARLHQPDHDGIPNPALCTCRC